MSEEIKTTGQLRKALLEAINDVKCKHLDVDRGMCMTKLASQVNESMRIEIMANRLLVEMGTTTQELGALPLTELSRIA